jgi:hypothetical protein
MKLAKNLTLLIGAGLIASTVASCGYSNAVIVNANGINTQVQLQNNNFKVGERVSGESSQTYIFMIGGMSHDQLYGNAYADMLKKADLSGGSKAIANVLTEEHIGGLFPIYFTRTIMVSGNVVEFTK